MLVNLIFIGLGLLFLVGAFSRTTELWAGFSRGVGPGYPISPMGRIVLLVIAAALVLKGVSGFLK